MAPAVSGKRTAFRLVLDGDKVDLVGQADLQGDFHRRRGRMAWFPGMLYCRLLDAQQRVLAEETLAAPEPACVLLNPPRAAGEGKPTASVLAAAAPVVFQVRLPKVAGATQLQVYRLTGPRPADAAAGTAARLLGTLVLRK